MGTKYIEDLQKSLADDSVSLHKIELLLEDLNLDLSTNKIREKIQHYFPNWNPQAVTNKTKSKRTYFVGGLTIHEED